jgi:hypothetical protein
MGTQGIYTVTNSVILGTASTFIQVVPEDDAVISSRLIISGSAASAALLFSATLADSGQPGDSAALALMTGSGGIIRSSKLAVTFEGHPFVIDWGPGPILVACSAIASDSVTVSAITTMVMLPTTLVNANTLSDLDEG